MDHGIPSQRARKVASYKKSLANFKIDRNGGEPIHRQIADQLRSLITTGEFKPGDKFPSLREISQTLGVNYLTARQAVKTLTEEGLLTSNLGKGSAVSQSLNQVKKLALVVPNLGQALIAEISRGVSEGLADKGIPISIFDYHDDLKAEIETYDRLHKESFCGAIVFASMAEESNQALLRLTLKGLPIVLVDRSSENILYSSVESDNVSGGFKATTHLIEMGYKRIAFIGYAGFNTTRKRHEGYRMALAQRKIVYDPKLVREVPSVSRAGTGNREATLDLIKAARADAIFYFNDSYALMGMRDIRQRGLDVPGDVAIVGFDDIPMASLSHPELTTIRQDGFEMGKKAIQLLLDQLAQGEGFMKQHWLVPVELVVRESSVRKAKARSDKM